MAWYNSVYDHIIGNTAPGATQDLVNRSNPESESVLNQQLGNALDQNPIDLVTGGVDEVLGDVTGQNQLDDAARLQREALQSAQDYQTQMYGEAQGYLDPYAQAGSQAFNRLNQNIQSGYYNQDPFGYSGQQGLAPQQQASVPQGFKNPVTGQMYTGQGRETLGSTQNQMANSIPQHIRDQFAGRVQTAQASVPQGFKNPVTGEIYTGQGRETLPQSGQNMIYPQGQGQQFNPNVGSISDFMGSMTENPAYKYQMEQMQKGIDRAGAAGGRWGGGQTAQEMMRGMGGIAAQSYGDMWNRATQEQQLAQGQEGLGYGRAVGEYGMENERLQNMLAQDQGLANVGLGASGQLANNAIGQGGQMSNLAIQQGNAAANAAAADRGFLGNLFDVGTGAVNLYGGGKSAGLWGGK